MRRLIPVLLALVLSGHLRQGSCRRLPDLPQGVTCEFVRAKVAEHGKVVAYAWARLQGYSKEEIKQAKRCLRETRL
jgi:uncharacterized protein YbaA (DUF1428 family)